MAMDERVRGGHPGRAPRLRVPVPVYRVLRVVVHLVNRLYWRVEVDRVSAAAVPAEGPVILAPVHRSFIDFFIVSEVTRRKLFYMAKDDLWSSRRFGSFLESLGGFPVNRLGTDRLALDRAQEVFERGDALILFPEGTRRAGAVVEDIHEGAAFLAARTGAPIVPIGIGGSYRAMPKGSRMVRPVKIYVSVGAPLAPPPRSERGRVPRSQVHRLTTELQAALQELTDAAEARAGRRS